MRRKLKVLFMGQTHLCADGLTALKSCLLIQLVITDLDQGGGSGGRKKHWHDDILYEEYEGPQG